MVDCAVDIQVTARSQRIPYPVGEQGDDPSAVECQTWGIGREVAVVPAAQQGYEIFSVPVTGT